jgi:uncharacterized membrane protein YphA (DoxX/SURF4 family)
LSRAEPTLGPAADAGLLALRIALGGLFIFAGYQKLFAGPFAPENFAEAIQAYRVTSDVALIGYATMIFPWVEIIAGVALVAGLWTRASGLVIGLLLTAFIAAIASVIFREIPISSCSCFGKYKLLCGNEALGLFKDVPPVGWCKVGENGLMVLMATALWTRGGGRLSLDAVLARPRA